MKTIYRASFCIGDEDESSCIPLSRVAERCIAWVFDRSSPLVEKPAELADDPLATIEQRAIGPKVTLETASSETEIRLLWGLRFEHPDASDDGLRWQTELIVRADKGPAATHFTCIQRRGARSDIVIPVRPTRSRPRIVQTLLDQYGGSAGLPLSSKAATLHQNEVASFVDTLLDDRRVRPIVFVSARNVDDRLVANGAEIASWLCGIAHVVVADSRFPSLALKDYLPERLRCWNGAVRIYWPGYRKSDIPYRHRLWSPVRVREIEERSGGGFREHLLAYVADAASSSVGSAVDTWEGIQKTRRQLLMADLRKAGKTEELVAVADETIRELESDKRNLEAEVQALRADIRAMRYREENLRKALEAKRGGSVAPADEDDLVPIEDVVAAVAQAKVQFSDKLVFQLNSASDVDTNPFDEPEEVWAALEWLGTTYYRARNGECSVSDFDLSLRDACGWGYHGHQSEVTMKKYKRWYTTKVDGKAYWLHEHIGTGSGKDARHTIRIGFDWDKARKIVVIGFIGQHQQTGAT